MTPQDHVTLMKRAATVAKVKDMETLSHELRMAEYDGWNRGFGDHEKLIQEFEPGRQRYEAICFVMGWALGWALAVVLFVK